MPLKSDSGKKRSSKSVKKIVTLEAIRSILRARCKNSKGNIVRWKYFSIPIKMSSKISNN
jgi:hypothetical protein